jgi:AcrR family transcriptional regulator
MTRTHIDKRSRLVTAAVDLAYQNGFGATSLADIARELDTKTQDKVGGRNTPARG